MFNLIPISLLIMSLGGLIYIVSSHLSEFEDEGKDESEFGIKARVSNWINQLPLDQVKGQSLSATQKFLHRMRILLLKADNGLMKLLKKLSEQEAANGNGKGQQTPDFWEDLSNKKENDSAEIIPETPAAEPELKIEFAAEKNEAVEKFFDPVRNPVGKEIDIKKPAEISEKYVIKPTKVSNGIDIKPIKKSFPAKKSTYAKKK